MVFIRALAIMVLDFFKRLSCMEEECLITIILSIVAAILIMKKRQKTKDDDQKWQSSINEGEDDHSILRSNVEELSSNVEELTPNLAGVKYYDFFKRLNNSDSGIDSPQSFSSKSNINSSGML